MNRNGDEIHWGKNVYCDGTGRPYMVGDIIRCQRGSSSYLAVITEVSPVMLRVYINNLERHAIFGASQPEVVVPADGGSDA